MPDRSITRRLTFLLALTLCTLLLVHFVAMFLLVRNPSNSAVVVMLLACALAIPRLRRVPVLGRCWLRTSLALTLMLSATALLGTGEGGVPEREKTAFIGATLITGVRGAAPIPRGVILVGADGRIEAVGDELSTRIPADYRRVDAGGRFLVPGLINAHGHLLLSGREPGEPIDLERMAMPAWLMDSAAAFMQTYPGRRLSIWQMERSAARALRGGVTTLRGLGDPSFGDVEVRKRIQSGQAIGPRLLASGPVLCVTGGHAHQIGQVIDGPVEARRAVRNALHHQVDQIKIASTGGVSDSRRIGEAGELQMTPAEVEAVTDEAHRKNVLVAAHAESAQGVLEALRAGVDNIEHGAELDAEAISLFKHNPKALRGYSTLHPTLSVIGGDLEITEAVRQNPALFVMVSNGSEIKRRMITGYRQALAAGIKIGVGTDAGIVRHDAVWKEMQYFVEIGGLSRQEALHLGTLGTAQSIGVSAITGSLEAGKSADFLIVERNPLEDLSALRAPGTVVASGVIYERD
ncbi:MAG: amidohydrolase family protein [bacterium]|nr:amidohydrolase family protein [bacterium]